MKKYLCGWSLAFLIVFSASAYAAPTGHEIMQIQKERHQAKDEEKRSEMHLIDRRGKKKVRDMVFYSFQGADKLNKAMLKFKSPADIRGVGVLTWGRASGDDDQWLYLPRARKLKRIVAGARKNKFMGTDLAFEDLRPENLDIHNYTLLREEENEGKHYFVIESTPSTPKEKKGSTYSKRIFWIRSDIYFPEKIEFLDKRGRLSKRSVMEELVNVSGEMWRAQRVTVENLLRKHKTITLTKSYQLDQGLEESFFFTQRVLKKPHTRD